MKFFGVKKNDALWPWDDDDAELFEAVPSLKLVSVEVKAQRNILFHKKFFTMLNHLVYAHPAVFSVEVMLFQVKMAAELYDVLQDPRTGKLVPKVRSISFANMEEADFRIFYNHVVKASIDYVIPRMRLSDVRRKALIDLIAEY